MKYRASTVIFLLLAIMLFTATEASPTVTVNGSCPFSPKFEILDYNVDLIPQDTFYGSDLVQDILADIVLRVKMVGNLTWINFTNYDAGYDTTLYFDFWCDTNTSSNTPIEMRLLKSQDTLSNSYFSNGRTVTELVWKYRIQVPPNATTCSAEVNQFVGSNLTWQSEINNNAEYKENHNEDLRCKNMTCRCPVAGLTHNLHTKLPIPKPVWSRQDFFDKRQTEISNKLADLTEKQANISNRMADISDRQLGVSEQAPMWGLGIAIIGVLGTLLGAVVGAKMSSNHKKNKINVKIETDKSKPHWLARLRGRQDGLMEWFANNEK